ncbi:MAG: hypothetical protein GF308_08480 [Candidatus Heimdallarchaeota archaeon]|nr:hypothetical protein [Candidatus Heimdallarchaeota archaeon]
MMDKKIASYLLKLKEGTEEEISAVAKTLSKEAKQIVELPRKQVAKILRSLLKALDRGDLNSSAELYGAIDKIILELTDKYDIFIGPDTTVSYDWYLGFLEEGSPD